MVAITINVLNLYNGLVNGAMKVIKNRSILNERNEFPVADRDTGNNLAYLMDYIIRNIERTNRIDSLLAEVSNTAILGARGNSGAIFSQFFIGFEKGNIRGEEINFAELTSMFHKGYEYAYQSIKDPVEGTILTAMATFVSTLNENKNSDQRVLTVLDCVLAELRRTVANTKFTMKKMINAKNEDAGALAFLYFVEGFIEGMLMDEVIEISLLEKIPTEYLEDGKEIHELDREITYRFCTEVLIKDFQIDVRSQIENQLALMGDSIVLSANDHLMRVHIHTNTPDKVAELMDSIGEIIEIKADDMIIQNRLSVTHENEIALVIDSIADLPLSLQKDFVFQIPMNLIVNNVSYQDKRTVFKGLFNKKEISSSQLNQEQVRTFLTPIVNKYRHVIVLTVSSKMSGLYDRFSEAIADYPDKVTLWDTKLNSVAEGLIANQAMKWIYNGLDVQTIGKNIENMIARTQILVSVPNLDAMIQSGRLNQKVGGLLKKIGLLPLITINSEGAGKIKEIAFNKNQNEKLFYKMILKNREKIENYALAHTYSENKVEEVAKRLTEMIGKPPLFVEQVSGVVANFSGVGSIAIGFTLKS